jgi:putative hydrolase of the HAD superfamily
VSGGEKRGERVPIVGIGLDATGTLFRAADLGGDYARVLARHGLAADAAELNRLVPEVWREFSCAADPARDRFAGHPGGSRGFWSDVLYRLCERAGLPVPSLFAAAELYQRFAGAAAWRLFDDVVPAIEALRERGLRLAVISNWDERLPRLLAALGIDDPFDAVVISCDVGMEKPHRAIFDAAASALDAPPERLLHVGDRRIEDLEGARAAGWHALLLDRGGGADLESLSELPERLAVLA